MDRWVALRGTSPFFRVLLGALILAIAAAAGARAATPGKSLKIYFIDVEGGQATLIVTPARQSLLIDTGWPGNGGRDAGRIAAVAKQAGIARLDYVLITHYHDDHVGGVAQLVARLPVGTFIDHGPNRETDNDGTRLNWDEYQKVLAGPVKRLIVKPGDRLPLAGVEATVVSADGGVITAPVEAGVPANDKCADTPEPAADTTENGRSLGVLFRFGALKILDLGDLTADRERALMCPRNLLGRIDVFIVSHHGFDQSNSPLLVRSIAPRVAIMDNGANKGGSPVVIDTVLDSPRLETLWQLHYSVEGGEAHNTAAAFVANTEGPDSGNSLELTAYSDGRFDVRNTRTGLDQRYGPQKGTPSAAR